MQEAIRQGRIKEWNNYKTFEAARMIPAEEAHDLMKQGYIPIDMQWIDVDKNAHKAAKITDKNTTEQILVKNDQEKGTRKEPTRCTRRPRTRQDRTP